MTTKRHKLHTSEEFHAEARKAGGVVLPVRKEATSEVSPGEGETLDFVISTETEDRSHDIVRASGWKLDSYRANPVVLWGHDYSEPPIGRAKTVFAEGGKLLAKGVEFTSRELNPFGHMVGELYRKGFMRATSVGFRPLKWAWREDAGGMGIEYQEHELLEFSAVTVPANAEALIGASAKGIDLTPMRAWAEKVLDQGEGGLWIPKEQLEDMRKALAPKQHVSPGVPKAEGEDEKPEDEKPKEASLEKRVAALESDFGAMMGVLEKIAAKVGATDEEPEEAPMSDEDKKALAAELSKQISEEMAKGLAGLFAAVD